MKSESQTLPAVSLPPDVPDVVKRQLLALGCDSELVPAACPIDELFIRHWCETLEDGNPLYLDESFARAKGLRGLMLPPPALYSAAVVPFRWPWPPKEGAGLLIHFRLKEILDLSVAIAADVEFDFFLPVQTGQRVFTSSRLVSVSEWKRTRLGEGRFFTYAHSFWTDQKEKAAEMRFTIFGYGRGTGQAIAPKGGYSNAVEEALEGDKTPYQPIIGAEICWEDVNEGDILPEIRMPITMTRCVLMASATRDFSPQHSNPDYAKKRSGTRDVFVNTQFTMGMVSRLVTDWAGPIAAVRRIKAKMQGNVCAGDDMIVTGQVTRKYLQGDEHRVDIKVAINNQDGPTTPCEATVALPSRATANCN
jgi:acyl dehydratase